MVGKGVRLLKDHPDMAAHAHRVNARAVDVLAIEEHLAARTGAGHQFMHPVEAADIGGLSATRGADHCRDLPLRYLHRNRVDDLLIAIPGS